MKPLEDSPVVLIVDDTPDNLSFLHTALDEAGYHVLVAIDGETALVRAQKLLPDLILMDANMPRMNGFEAARALKANPTTAFIPIIFMTGLTDTKYVLEAFSAGSVDYVTKPVNPLELIARIAAHLRTAQELHQAKKSIVHWDDDALKTKLIGEFTLTPKESVVVAWLIKGKTNRDIGEIMGISHRTVNKHLEHIFTKLGVETRTAATNAVLQRLSPAP